jgi:hypothetical protein
VVFHQHNSLFSKKAGEQINIEDKTLTEKRQLILKAEILANIAAPKTSSRLKGSLRRDKTVRKIFYRNSPAEYSFPNESVRKELKASSCYNQPG